MKKTLAALMLAAVAIVAPAAGADARTAGDEAKASLFTKTLSTRATTTPYRCIHKVRYTRTKTLPSGLVVRYTRTRVIHDCH
jgi:hypothetical protein